jgi:hypothetical protein
MIGVRLACWSHAEEEEEKHKMNAVDVLKYGHQTVLRTIDGLPEAEWKTPGVCGVWSVKDIIAHLASFEYVLEEVLATFLDGGTTPYLDQFKDPSGQFNDTQVARRKDQSVAETLAEYNDSHARVMMLVTQIPEETLRQPGTLPWYGTEYALDDFIVYTYYGHKREHSAQIAMFRDRLQQ